MIDYIDLTKVYQEKTIYELYIKGIYHMLVINKSSAVAEMGDRGHKRHGPKRGGLLCPFRGN